MNLQKQPLEVCPACGARRSAAREFQVRAHLNSQCVRTSTGFFDTSLLGDEITPHLHVVCPTCTMEWLEEVYRPTTIRDVL